MKPPTIAALAALAFFCTSAPAQNLRKETEFRASLMSPLSTQTSKKGDSVTARVVSPDQFKGAILEGKVQESKSGAKLKGTSVLNFTFDMLNQNGQTTKVQANIKEIVNSKGKSNVDEEGRVLTHKNSLGKVALVTGIGAL